MSIERTNPITGTEAKRRWLQANAATIEAAEEGASIGTQEIHTSVDGAGLERIFRAHKNIGRTYHLGNVADEAEMLALDSPLTSHACLPGDTCFRSDTQQIMRCVSNHGVSVGDWEVVSSSADPAGTAATAVSTHNTATDSHTDLRTLIDGKQPSLTISDVGTALLNLSTPVSVQIPRINADGSVTLIDVPEGVGGCSARGLYSGLMSETIPSQSSTGLTTWVNQGAATVADVPLGLQVHHPSTASAGNICGLVRAAPTAPYELTALLELSIGSGQYPSALLGWADSASTKTHMVALCGDGRSGLIYADNYASWGFSSSNAPMFTREARRVWLRFADTGDSISVHWSHSGASWIQLYSSAKSSGYLGANGYNQLFFGVTNWGSSAGATLLSWSFGTANLPGSIVGHVVFKGQWDASSNDPALPDASSSKGFYYVTSVAGSYGGIDYGVGDWCISDGSTWGKVDNSDAITSFAGRVGAILPIASDYSAFYLGVSAQAADSAKLGGVAASEYSKTSHTHAFSSLTSKPTTLAGYGITDAAAASHGHTAGVVVRPTITRNGNGTITVGSDGIYALYTEDTPSVIGQFSCTGGTFTLTEGATHYLLARYSGGSASLLWTTDRSQVEGNFRTVIPIETLYLFGGEIHGDSWDEAGHALAEKMLNRLINTSRYVRDEIDGGLALGELTGRIVTISSGSVWRGVEKTQLEAFNSSTSGRLLLHVWNGTSWTVSQVTQYDNTSYQGASGLVTLQNTNRYSVNWIFRTGGDDADCVLVLGTGDYTIDQALASGVPSNLPALATKHGFLVGRIIVAKGAASAYRIESAFTTSFQSGVVLDHGALSNLQGGTIGEYYHQSYAQWLRNQSPNTANNIAVVGSDGKLLPSLMPDIAVVDFIGEVSSQSAMLTLVGQKGDWCTRTDLGTNWQIVGNDSSQSSSWRQLTYPQSPVNSVFGETGAITAKAAHYSSFYIQKDETVTWTPSITFQTPPTGLTFSDISATSHLVGSLCYINLGFRISSKGSAGGGQIVVTGFPVPSRSVQAYGNYTGVCWFIGSPKQATFGNTETLYINVDWSVVNSGDYGLLSMVYEK